MSISGITYLTDIYCFLIGCYNVISSSKSEDGNWPSPLSHWLLTYYCLMTHYWLIYN